MPSVYKRSVNGAIIYYAKLWDPETEKVVRRSTGCHDRREAIREADRLQSELEAQTLEPDYLSRDRAWSLYHAWALGRKQTRTINHEHMFWSQFWEWSIHDNYYAVTPLEAIAWREDLSTEICATGRRRSPHSVNDALRALATIFGRISVLEKTGHNPFSTLSCPRINTPPPRPRFVNRADMEKVLQAARDYSSDGYLFVALGLFAGLRKGEILGLKWGDIELLRTDQDGREIGCITVWESEDHKLKTRAASRVIPLHPDLRVILDEYWGENDQYIIRPEVQHKQASGYRWNPRKLFEYISEETGVPVTPHVLRHTFASHLAMKGVSLHKIGSWLGHTSVVTTEIYAHLCPVDSEIGKL